jgi:hypothetical protein
MSLVQRADRFKGTGKIVSIEPSTGTPLTELDSYMITSTGRPASVIHAQNPIHKPGTTTNIDANAVFFEPTESYGEDGVPRFSQLVINGQLTAGSVKVSEYKEYFTVTDPGVMSTQGYYANADESGGAARTPKVTRMPYTYPRRATVRVFLTTSSDASSPLQAYNNDGVDWCSISFSTFTFNEERETASVSASFRTFGGYLNSSGTTDEAFSDITANTVTKAYSFGEGSEAYTTTGLYRSKVVPFIKDAQGNQLFLRTDVTF